MSPTHVIVKLDSSSAACAETGATSTDSSARTSNFVRMCRNIRTLHNFEPPATDDEVRAASLQYVRKISGYTKPSAANQEAFDRAVEAVAAASHELLDAL